MTFKCQVLNIWRHPQLLDTPGLLKSLKLFATFGVRMLPHLSPHLQTYEREIMHCKTRELSTYCCLNWLASQILLILIRHQSIRACDSMFGKVNFVQDHSFSVLSPTSLTCYLLHRVHTSHYSGYLVLQVFLARTIRDELEALYRESLKTGKNVTPPGTINLASSQISLNTAGYKIEKTNNPIGNNCSVNFNSTLPHCIHPLNLGESIACVFVVIGVVRVL